MTYKVLAACTVLVALLASRAAGAQTQTPGQPDSPQWLKDRKFSEGAGVRAGEFEFHPGIAGEVGYDSNFLLRTDRSNCGGIQCANGPPVAPVISALEFRITPSITLETLTRHSARGRQRGHPTGRRLPRKRQRHIPRFRGPPEPGHRRQRHHARERSFDGPQRRRRRASRHHARQAGDRWPLRQLRARRAAERHDDRPERRVQPRRLRRRYRSRHPALQRHARLAPRVPAQRCPVRAVDRPGLRRLDERGLDEGALEVPASDGAHLRRDASVHHVRQRRQGRAPGPRQLDAGPDADRVERAHHRPLRRPCARRVGRELLRHVAGPADAAVRQRHRTGGAQVVHRGEPRRRQRSLRREPRALVRRRGLYARFSEQPGRQLLRERPRVLALRVPLRRSRAPHARGRRRGGRVSDHLLASARASRARREARVVHGHPHRRDALRRISRRPVVGAQRDAPLHREHQPDPRHARRASHARDGALRHGLEPLRGVHRGRGSSCEVGRPALACGMLAASEQ